ncbi:hypothetical protein CLAVI_000890 [Candidatus Clavichlamydia salmonicola]|uniref:hypothetical protein n=1 Tax=Candidatus Clavichlamydia salmonicola TaxID=469812 RepID=UPI00189148AF|nr:hypothetical protein [Candidatus Clavichlamydia salmonicola]MBF5051249.1 hypothetical protein [Candidatus Clavichlamydia salmonicola]
MTTFFNPIFVNLLLSPEKHLALIEPIKHAGNTPFTIKHHLEKMARDAATASLQNYSFENACLQTTTIPETSCQNTFTLQIFVSKLHQWLHNNSSSLIATHGLSFYTNIIASLGNPKKETQTKTVSTTSSQPYQGLSRKHRLLGHPAEQESIVPPLAKQARIEDAQPITSTASLSYQLQEIVMLEDTVMSIQTSTITDLSTWIAQTHLLASQVLSHHEIFFVSVREDIPSLAHESILNLRSLTLQVLQRFLSKHTCYIDLMSDIQEKKTTTTAHHILLKDIQYALLELENTIQAAAEAMTVTTDLKPLTSIKNIKTKKNKSSFSKTKQKAVKMQKNSCLYIGIRTHLQHFSLVRRQTMNHGKELKKFFNQVKKVSIFKKCSCVCTIPEMHLNQRTTNPLNIISLLYHTVSRNYYVFTTSHPRSISLKTIFHDTLDTLNKQYCLQKKITPNPLNHHPDLLKVTVSAATPPLPIESQPIFSYISIVPDKIILNTFWIRKIHIQSDSNPSSSQRLHLKLSISKHDMRMKKLFELSLEKNYFIKCNDNCWPVKHLSKFPISRHQLCEIAYAISEKNLLFFGSYFQRSKETILDVEEIMTLTMKSFKDFSSTSTSKTVSSTSISYFTPVATPLLSLKTTNHRYEMSMRCTSSNKRENILKSSARQALKLAHHAKKILSNSRFSYTSHEGLNVNNKQHFLVVLHEGVICNTLFLKQQFEGTFARKFTTQNEIKYQKTLSVLKEITTLIHQTWKTLFPGKPIQSIHEVEHPLKNLLIQFHNRLEGEKSSAP